MNRRHLLLALLVAVSAVLIAALGLMFRSRQPAGARTFEVQIRASAGTMAQLYWAPDRQFSSERSIWVPLDSTASGFQRLRFPLPGRNVRWLRFHPTDVAAEVWIGDLRLNDWAGHTVAVLDPDGLRPGHQIASIARQGALTRVVTNADDPFLILSIGCQDRPAFWQRLGWTTPATVLAAAILLTVLLAACAAIVVHAGFRSEPQAPRASRRLSAMWLAGLFLLVFSAKLLLMREHPVTVPFWDQWNGEAESLYIPFHDCDLSWRTMFSLHNEHRIFFTRLLALTLLILDGQWDPRFQQVVNAAIHSVTAVLLVMSLWVADGRRRLDFFVFVGALTFALPFAWENVLFGFQSAFYFLLLFSVLALWLTTRHRVGSAPWLIGWCCAACGLFTMASGLAIPVAIAAVTGMKLADERRDWKKSLANGAVGGAIFALALAVASPRIAGHDSLRAQTVADFGGALARNLAWPWAGDLRLGIVMWLPLAVWLALVLRRRMRTTALERFILGLTVWVAFHVGAVAFARGAGATSPATRYMDLLSLGLIVNATALVATIDRVRTRLLRRLMLAAAVSWLVVAVAGMTGLLGRTLDELRNWTRAFAVQSANVRRFVISGDLAYFVSRPPLSEIPYPDVNALARLLQDPVIRRILPPAVREPLRVDARIVTQAAFVSEDQNPRRVPWDPLTRTWSSLSALGNRAQGQFESQPMSCRSGGQLRFQVSGYLGWEHQYLAVKDLQSGRDLAVRPSRLARESWTEADVPCPPGAFEIVAIDVTPDSWFAFREPVEIGGPSLMAERLIGWSLELFLVAVATVVLAARWT